MYFNKIKAIYGKPMAKIILNGEKKLKSISTTVRNNARVFISSLLLNIVLEIFARAIRQEKKIKA